MTTSGPIRRAVHRFSRRSLAVKVRTVLIFAIAIAIVAGYFVFAAGPSKNTGANPLGHTGGRLGYTPVTQASTSTRGIVGNEINVIFPIVALNTLAGQEDLSSSKEFGDQDQAIDLYVGLINNSGGIDGRKINPIIVTYDPTNEVEMRALCKQWTEGTPAAFAVLDGIGAWQDQDELCITQEGHTPLISQWSSVTDWTNVGSPYLWWIGADQAAILNTVVHWGLSTGRIQKDKPLGIVVGDLTSDQVALNQYLLPDLKSLGVAKVDVEEIASQTSEAAETNTEAPLAVERLKAAGVTTVLPMLRVNALFPFLAAEASQEYYPTLLLSDYESEIQIGLGLIPIPFEKELNGQEGVTTLTLGGIDDNRPESEGGYDPAVRKCWQEWIAKYPGPYNRNFIEEQGPIAAWCGVINLFAAAARKAGKNLNRRAFVEAMSSIQNFPGTWEPNLSFGPDKFYGPTEYRVVEIHNNIPEGQCPRPKYPAPPGTCWVIVQNWRSLYPPA
jgi:Periplasmic binding protein